MALQSVKRQRTAALQNLADGAACEKTRWGFGARLPLSSNPEFSDGNIVLLAQFRADILVSTK